MAVKMRRVLKNAVILEGRELEPAKGYLVIEDGVIREIGSGRAPYKNALDLKGGIVSPAFINAHIHLGDSIAPDLGAYMPLLKRVGKGGLKYEALTEREVKLKNAIKASLSEMFWSGTTCFCDFREGGSKGVRLLRSLVMHHGAVILGRPDEDEKPEDVLRLADGIGISGMADYGEDELDAMAMAAKKGGKLLGVHAGELEDDVKRALELKPDFIVHATIASAESLEACAESRTPIVLCARANAMSAVGLPPMDEIFAKTMVAIGTDNVMVNSPNMLREVEFIFKTIRGVKKDHEFDAVEVLKAATFNGRRILGLEDNSLRPGNRADLIIFNRRKYIYDPILAVIHRYEAADIRGVVVGDKFFGR
ncbi:MAG: amidohydrolase family protein [Candidatus Hydrothermarchaeaceae archaeon]